MRHVIIDFERFIIYIINELIKKFINDIIYTMLKKMDYFALSDVESMWDNFVSLFSSILSIKLVPFHFTELELSCLI